MLKKILLAFAAVVVLFTIVVMTRPATFHIERSMGVAAPPAAVFAQVNDFHTWAAWSPWEKLDPQIKKTFEGPATGVGSTYAWTGNDKVGEGKMTIQKSDAPSLVLIKLEFLKPFAATNTATFTIAPAPEGTKVTWAMDGENNFVAKAASMFMDMDKMIGSDFEKGLAGLKTIAETAAKSAPEPNAAIK